jgi:hypothetical protein
MTVHSISRATDLLVTNSFSGSDRMDNLLKDHRCPILAKPHRGRVGDDEVGDLQLPRNVYDYDDLRVEVLSSLSRKQILNVPHSSRFLR